MQNTVYARKGRVNVWMILNLSGTIFVELLGVNVITPAFSLIKKGANKASFFNQSKKKNAYFKQIQTDE